MFVLGRSKFDNDKGFSIVELIIVVSILAIASIPLMRSMTMATRVNKKAQSMQNATSAAEKIMEETKSMSVEELQTKFGGSFDPSGKYEFTRSNVYAGQDNEKFTATITIDRNKYTEALTPAPGEPDFSDEAKKVHEANKLKLPSIEDIDTLSQAVLSSTKEFNRYDSAAQSYFNEKKDDYKKSDPSTYAEVKTKTIDIVKTDAPGAYNGVTVKAGVTYTDQDGNKYVRDLYNGTFIADYVEGSTTEFKKLDSNIYIFYTKGVINGAAFPETINITDNSGPTVEEATDSHRIYLIRQQSADTSGPKEINLLGSVGSGTFTFSSLSSTEDGILDYGNIKVVTNLGSSGHMYKEEQRYRVYDVTVVLTKAGDTTEYARLNSTMTANDPTPTPTPTPVPTI